LELSSRYSSEIITCSNDSNLIIITYTRTRRWNMISCSFVPDSAYRFKRRADTIANHVTHRCIDHRTSTTLIGSVGSRVVYNVSLYCLLTVSDGVINVCLTGTKDPAGARYASSLFCSTINSEVSIASKLCRYSLSTVSCIDFHCG
jgi:hypothetical protein